MSARKKIHSNLEPKKSISVKRAVRLKIELFIETKIGTKWKVSTLKLIKIFFSLFKVILKDTAVVTANKKTGQLILDSGGWRTVSTLGAINTALRPIRMQVVETTTGKFI